MDRTYNAYETKRRCEKLHSDIICFNVNNLQTKDEQWSLYFSEKQKILDEVKGDYDKLQLYDELFSVGDTIKIHYLDTVAAIIESIRVEENMCTWNPEYIIIAKEVDSEEKFRVTYIDCIHKA